MGVDTNAYRFSGGKATYYASDSGDTTCGGGPGRWGPDFDLSTSLLEKVRAL